MIDYARPYEQNVCDMYPPATPPAPARLDDFQVFKKVAYNYENYYKHYDIHTEPEVEATANVYHNLVSTREYHHDNWKFKVIAAWTEDDTMSWLMDCTMKHGYNECDVPIYNFRVSGLELRTMRREEFVQRMSHPNIDPAVSRSISDMVFDELQIRLKEEMLHPSYLRYGESDPYHDSVQTVLDLDSINQRNRLYTPDYKMSDLITTDFSDDPEDVLRSSETASPECSDGSKSSDDEEKRKMFKRPPGRPKGSGRKVCKRPRSVSVPEFLRNLLFDEKYCPSIIKWEDHSQGKFRFVKPDEVAKLWGQMKQNDNMTFEKFSRAMRYHYRQSVLVSVPTARLVYQFGHKGPDFKTDNPNFVRVKSEIDVHEVHDSPYTNS